MKHRNYDGIHPPSRPRDEVLREFGISSRAPLLLCVGQVRPHKGPDLVCEAVARLGDRVSLLIAGATADPSYADRIQQLVRPLPNAAFIDRHLTEEEFADCVGASDIVVLPYRSVTGSGAALASLTLGRAVIPSDPPFFVDLLRGHESAGRFFATGDAGSLTDAILRFLEVAPAERERAARDLAEQYAWDRFVPPIATHLSDLWELARGGAGLLRTDARLDPQRACD